MASRSSAKSLLLGFGCVAAPIGNPGEAVAAVSVCGPMNRMMFDQRLTAPIRMTAMGIWRNVEDGPQRVAPTLQPLRPLLPRRPRTYHDGPAVRVSLDPQIAPLIEALDAGFPPVHTMTGAQARATIRSRFVPPREPEPVAEIRDATVPGPGGDIPVRVYRPTGGGPPADSRVCPRRRLRVLRSGQPRRIVPRYRQSHSSRCGFGGLPAGSGAPVARGGRGRLRRDPVGRGQRGRPRAADARRVVVGGDSAGGNLAAVTDVDGARPRRSSSRRSC